MKKLFTLGLGILAAGMASEVKAQVPFSPIDTNYTSNVVIVPPSPLRMDTLFVGNHHYVNINGGADSALAKQNHDFIGLVPVNGSKKAWLIVNHEITNTKNAKLGDGGGQTSFLVEEVGLDGKGHGKGVATKWQVAPSIGGKNFHNVDFSPVRGTNVNCGGATTLYGTTLTAEEYPRESNKDLWSNGNGFQDTSDYTIPAGNGPYSGQTIKFYENFGWMVEADPATATATKKFYAMGRFSHEGGWVMEDGKTVYLTDDFTPGIFFKFVADKKNDYTSGQLYAYKQGANGVGGSWITLPMDLQSLINIREVALDMGATMFTRLEWITGLPHDKNLLYIAETGSDNVDYNSGLATGGTMAYHNKMADLSDGIDDNKLNDYYGRVLEFNAKTNTMRSYLEGGTSNDGKTNFSNVDGIAATKINGKTYLFLQEDLNGRSRNRMPVYRQNTTICEAFFLDASIKNPTVDDLHRFMIAVPGAEITGGVFTPDGRSLFVNIQHPSSSNPFPFNNSTTVAVTGFHDYLAQMEASKKATIEHFDGSNFVIYPNPASRELYFNSATDVSLYDMSGKRIMVERNVKSLDISMLAPGTYFIQTIDGEVQKVIVQ